MKGTASIMTNLCKQDEQLEAAHGSCSLPPMIGPPARNPPFHIQTHHNYDTLSLMQTPLENHLGQDNLSQSTGIDSINPYSVALQDFHTYDFTHEGTTQNPFGSFGYCTNQWNVNLEKLESDHRCPISPLLINPNNQSMGPLSTTSASSASMTSGVTSLHKDEISLPASSTMNSIFHHESYTNSYDASQDHQHLDHMAKALNCNGATDRNYLQNDKKKKKKKTRKRKRSPHKNAEEMESQRMTHIAVERNRRKQMNEHLRTLRELMPSSYIQRGDQASIVGATIRFVEELEQAVQSLRLQRQLRGYIMEYKQAEAQYHDDDDKRSASFEFEDGDVNWRVCQMMGHETMASSRSDMAEVEVKMVASTASSILFSVKVLAQRRPHQLLHTIAALKSLCFKVVQLIVTTTNTQPIILYSVNLQMEDTCQIQTPFELAEFIQHVFSS